MKLMRERQQVREVVNRWRRQYPPHSRDPEKHLILGEKISRLERLKRPFRPWWANFFPVWRTAMSWIDGGWVSFSGAEVAQAYREGVAAGRKAALEEAAKVCEEEGGLWLYGEMAGPRLAASIRALKEK